MNNIRILDCTLRDGGYVNNWEFGHSAIVDIKNALEDAGVYHIELGFFRNEEYKDDRSIYDSVTSLKKIMLPKKTGHIYGGLIEMANYFPPKMLEPKMEGGPEAIRYSFWKRLMDDAFDYCRIIKEKGYLLCCQATRAEQYTDEDFAELCTRFSTLKPYALYIVDTFGLLGKKDVVRYAKIANEFLDPDVILGYHAHNNMGQAFANACAFLELDFGERTVQLDASIGGIGRGAGNLDLMQILEYLNSEYGGNYDTSPIDRVWDKHLAEVKKKYPWGFHPAYYIAAKNHCNPNYASYFLDKKMGVSEIRTAVSLIEGDDKFLYSNDKAEAFFKRVRAF